MGIHGTIGVMRSGRLVCCAVLLSGAFQACRFNATGLDGVDGAITPDAPPGAQSLAVLLSGAGTGTVTSTPVGIDCGLTCTASFLSGASIALVAFPDPTSQFAGWSGDCTGTADECALIVEGPKQVTATFVPVTDLLWGVRHGSPGVAGSGLDVAIDTFGNVLVAGYVAGSTDFGLGPTTGGAMLDMFVAKYAPDGPIMWAARFGGAGNDLAFGVAVTLAGDVVITGSFEGVVDFDGTSLTAAGSSDAFVAKLAGTDGSIIWAKEYGDAAAQVGSGITTDAGGDIYVTGQFAGTINWGGGNPGNAGGNDIFVARLDGTDGAHMWSTSHGGTGSDFGQSIEVGPAGDIVVAGGYTNGADLGGGAVFGAGLHDIFVASYDAVDGAFNWENDYGGLGEDIAQDVAVGAGRIVVTGRYVGPISVGGGGLPNTGTEDVFVAAYDSIGMYVWSRGFGDIGVDVGQSVSVGPGGTVVVTGRFVGSVDFGGGPVAAQFVDIFVVELSTTGMTVLDRTYGGGGEDVAYGVGTDGAGNVLVTGELETSVDFGTGPLAPIGQRDIFVVKLRP